MFVASELLPEPAPEVVQELIIEINRLRRELKKIAEPINFLHEQAEASGSKLVGAMAVRLANDAQWLSDIAKKALDENC